MTKGLYLENTYQFENDALVIALSADERGPFIELDQTIFYPQGGGQPSDQGVIKGDNFEIFITSVRYIPEGIRHYYTLTKGDLPPVPFKVICSINKERHLLNACYHTAAHLLENVAEKIYPAIKAVKGHSFPKKAYVEFSGTCEINNDLLKKESTQALANGFETLAFEIDPFVFEEKFYPLPDPVLKDKTFRAVQIDTMPPVPCGGPHVSSLKEINQIHIGKIKVKNDITHISYDIA